MYEQFIMVKHEASFYVHRNEDRLTIKALQPGKLYPMICDAVATAQQSIAQFYLIEQRRLGNRFCSLMAFFDNKGWLIQEEADATSNAATVSSALPIS